MDINQPGEAPGTSEPPPLWNPNAAALWSLLFSPIFGALVHMKNWQALGQTERADRSRRWAMGVAVFLLLLVMASLVLPDSKGVDAMERLLGFVLLIAWYYDSGKPQVTYVLGRYGQTYPRRGWGKPLLYAVLAFAGFIVLSALVGFIAGMLAGQG